MYCSSSLSLFHLRLLSREWKRSTQPLENFLCVPSHLTATPTFPVPHSPFRSGPVYQYLPSICCFLAECHSNIHERYFFQIAGAVLNCFDLLLPDYLPTCLWDIDPLSALAAQVTHGHKSNALAPARVHDSRKSVQLMVLENKNIHFKVNVQALQESKKNLFFLKCGDCVVMCEGVLSICMHFVCVELSALP